MKIHSIPLAASMAAIAESGSMPIQKQEIPDIGRDQRMMGNTLAQEVLAHARNAAQSWAGFAWRVIKELTTDGRVAFLRAIKDNLDDMRKANEQEGFDAKLMRKRIASATVYVSQLNTIANAFNGGASVEGLAAYHGVNDPENLGFVMIYEYAQIFSKSAAGRKRDALIVKLGKWLDGQKKEIDQFTAEDRAVYATLVAKFNELKPAE
jgi:hypothetical protein